MLTSGKTNTIPLCCNWDCKYYPQDNSSKNTCDYCVWRQIAIKVKKDKNEKIN